MGEYARALALAIAASRRWPQLQIHFAVSKAAPYAAGTPFPTTLLPSSPTFHTREMADLIRAFRPTLVVFDNAGRTAQLRAAVNCGARLAFVSSRPRQRRKAFRLRWMRMLDEHWIAYPEFIAGRLGPLERFKLRLLGRPSVRFLDAVLPPADAAVAASMMAKFNIASGEYVLVVPGGGTDHPGARNAPQIVAEAARQIAARGFPTVLVGVAAPATVDSLRVAPRMPMSELAELIRGARLVISNGGDTLLQAIAANRPCIAVPIAGDQAHRIEQCKRAGLALGAKLDAGALSESALDFLADGSGQAALTARLQTTSVTNGLEIALSAIGRLAAPP
jgi:ADP-heptose:LPS heptosyltransferase